jgi:hypothetical protein
VVYKLWDDKARQRQIAKILEEIISADPPKHYVSMECLFKGFNYLVMNSKGESQILERTEKTASLTRHLRAYGGNGVFGEYRIARVLKGIIFSAHGIVENPANKDSIIFPHNNNLFLSKSVYNILSEQFTGENSMTDLNNVEKVLAELKEEVAKSSLHKMHALEAQIDALKKGADEHHRELEKRHGDLSSLQKEHEEKMAAVGKELDEWKNKAEAAAKKAEEDEKEMARLKAENEYEKKVTEEFKKASKKASRAEALKKTNINSNRLNTEGLMDTLAGLDDATFDAIIQVFAKDKKEKVVDDEDEDDAKADFGAHRIDGEPQTSDSTQTQDVDQFGKPKKPVNPLTKDCSTAANPNNIITAAVIEENANLGVSVDIDKSYAKVQEQILSFLSPKKKK